MKDFRNDCARYSLVSQFFHIHSSHFSSEFLERKNATITDETSRLDPRPLSQARLYGSLAEKTRRKMRKAHRPMEAKAARRRKLSRARGPSLQTIHRTMPLCRQVLESIRSRKISNPRSGSRKRW